MLDTFKIETFEDILRALKERPEWLEELRRIILTDELIALPQKFEVFVKQEFKPMKVKVDKLEQDVSVLKQDVAVLKQDVAALKESDFERKVRERAPAYFGRLIKRCRVLSFEALADALDESLDRGIITEDEKLSSLNLDVVARGFLRTDREKEVILAGEISLRVDRSDVERASERADILSRAFGIETIAVVIGKESTEGARTRAEELGVVMV